MINYVCMFRCRVQNNYTLKQHPTTITPTNFIPKQLYYRTTAAAWKVQKKYLKANAHPHEKLCAKKLRKFMIFLCYGYFNGYFFYFYLLLFLLLLYPIEQKVNWVHPYAGNIFDNYSHSFCIHRQWKDLALGCVVIIKYPVGTAGKQILGFWKKKTKYFC